MSKFVGYGKKLFDLARGGGKDSGKTKVSTTIVGVNPKVGSLTERRKHFEDLVKGTDKYTKSLTEEGRIQVKKSVQPAAKKISKIMDKKDKIDERNKASKKFFNKGGRVGLKSGTQLSAKQMKIASLAGNKKKIDGADFKKLRAMKSPMDKTVRKA